MLLAPTVTALQTLLEVCRAYAGPHDIVYNTTKTVCMLVRPKQSQRRHSTRVRLGNEELSFVGEFRYLGHVMTADCRDAKRYCKIILKAKCSWQYAGQEVLICTSSHFASGSSYLHQRSGSSHFDSESYHFASGSSHFASGNSNFASGSPHFASGSSHCYPIYGCALRRHPYHCSIRKASLSYGYIFKHLIKVNRYTSSILAFTLKATNHIDVVFCKSTYSLMSRLTTTPNSIVTAIVNSDAYHQSPLIYKWESSLFV